MKHNSKAIALMDDQEVKLSVYKLIIKICAITGWQIPAKEITDIIVEQMILKLKENYKFLNVDEIEYCFRTYRIEEYGKNFNLNALDSVIQPYLHIRKEIDMFDEKNKVEIYNSPRMTDDEKLYELQYYGMDPNKFTGKKIYLLPTYLYDYLVEFNFIDISKDAKQKKFDQAIEFYESELYADTIGMQTDPLADYKQFIAWKKNGFADIDNRTLSILDGLHKRFYILEYLKNVK